MIYVKLFGTEHILAVLTSGETGTKNLEWLLTHMKPRCTKYTDERLSHFVTTDYIRLGHEKKVSQLSDSFKFFKCRARLTLGLCAAGRARGLRANC